MQQLFSGMTSLTDTSVSERVEKISVADTLNHARRALTTHREWLQRRVSVSDEEKTREGDQERLNVDGEEEEDEQILSPTRHSESSSAPPIFWRRRRRSQIVPIGIEPLTEEDEDVIATESSHQSPPALDNKENNEGTADQPSPISKRPKKRWTSKAAVVCPSNSDNVPSDAGPSPVHLFTSRSPTIISNPAPAPAPAPVQNLPSLTGSMTAWGSLSSLDNYIQSLHTDTESSKLPVNTSTLNDSSQHLHATVVENPARRESDGENASTPNASSKKEMTSESSEEEEEEEIKAPSHNESTATILAVGPAPREKQSSYKIHQLSKLEEMGRRVRMVEVQERDSSHLESLSEIRLTPGWRLTSNMPLSTSETAVMEDVLPYKKEESVSISSGSGREERDEGDGGDGVNGERGDSDDEVFQPTPAHTHALSVAEERTELIDTSSISTSTDEYKTASKIVQVTSGAVEHPPVLEIKGIERSGVDLSFQPRVTSTPAGDHDDRMTEEDSMLQASAGDLQETRPASVLSRLSRIKSEPLLSSSHNITIPTELRLSRRRNKVLPSYTIHHCTPSELLTLNPPCPPYGVQQPDIIPDHSRNRKRILSAPPANTPPSLSPLKEGLLTVHSHRNPPLRHTMSTPEEGERGVAFRRVTSEQLELVQTAHERRALTNSDRYGSTVSLYQMQAGPGPLHLAAKSGNPNQVKALISDGANVNARDHDGRTPLMYCIQPRGVHISCANLLIQAGAGLDKQASDGSTIIHHAAAFGALSLIEFALLNKADPDVKDFDGRLPLHWATTYKQSTKCAAQLLKHSKLDINAVDDAGMTPLMWTVYNNNTTLTTFFLAQGADCEEKDRDGLTAMHWAVVQNATKCLELILKADHTYFKDHRGRTVLHLAAEVGSLSACELILRLRGDAVHDLDRMGRTPLHYAAACSRVDICVLLLDRGCDAAQRDLTGKTAVDYGRVKQFDYVVALLTCHGTAVADFARTSRSTSVSSLLNRAKSFSDLPTSGNAPDLITESLQPLADTTLAEEEEEDNDEEEEEQEEVDKQGTVSLNNGAFLGRFVSDKSDPVQHFYFWVEPGTSLLHWSRNKDRYWARKTRVYEVHTGPSKTLQKSPVYTSSELYPHVFWIKTDSGIIDLLAYNKSSYHLWISGLGKITQPLPLPLTSSEGSEEQGQESTSKIFQLKFKRPAAVAPALVIENESTGDQRGDLQGNRTRTAWEDSEVELPDINNYSRSQGPPQND